MSLAGFLWRAAASAATPVLPLWLAHRAGKGKEFSARLGERRGVAGLPRPDGALVWVHGASVGETASVVPLIEALRAENPDLGVLLTSGTATSAALLARRLGGEDAAPEHSGALPNEPQVAHQFVPLDSPAFAEAFLDHWRPDLALFVESELWPNLLAGLRARKIPAALVNARISARSFGRWRKVPGFAREVFSTFTRVLAQSHDDAARLAELGANPSVPGNLKWSASPLPADPAEHARLSAMIGGRPAWVMASTHPGDEALAAAAHHVAAQAHPDLLTIIVPRHPDRGAAIANEFSGLGVAIARRAANQDPQPGTKIWLADTLGELGLIYRLAPVAVMGKSFLPPGGGQNPLEPARLGRAVLFGPRMQNFTAIAQALLRAGAAQNLENETALGPALTDVLNDGPRMATMGAAAISLAAEQDRVLERVMDALRPLLPAATSPPMPASGPAA
jgi:3-deoxy-D-manno-octulosonic-acid transferase